MTGSRFVDHGALITGPAAFLLSRWLRSPPVVALFRTARWLHGPDVAQALNAIHEAGRAWEATINLPQRNNAMRCQAPRSNCVTLTVEEASEALNIGKRRVQQLARDGHITGRRVGQRWELDAGSVTAYQRQQKRKTQEA